MFFDPATMTALAAVVWFSTLCALKLLSTLSVHSAWSRHQVVIIFAGNYFWGKPLSVCARYQRACAYWFLYHRNLHCLCHIIAAHRAVSSWFFYIAS